MDIPNDGRDPNMNVLTNVANLPLDEHFEINEYFWW